MSVVVAAAAAKRKAGDPGGMPVIKQVKREASDEEREAEVEERVETAGGEVATIVAAEETVKEETVATTATLQTDGQQICIIQTADGAIPVESAGVVVADDMAVYEAVSALEQLSRGQVVTTAADGEQLIQVYEEVVLPESGEGSGMDSFVDVAEVEVGDGRSASPIKIDTGAAIAARLKASANAAAANTIAAANGTIVAPPAAGGEFHICRICNQFVPVTDIAEHNSEHHGAVSDLTCLDCGKIFKSKRSLFGHRKEKHSGVTEVHSCPECGKTFGRKSNLKAHRESLHYGKKFPCQLCDRIFTNRSSMNQHIKKTHNVAGVNLDDPNAAGGTKIIL